MNRLYNGIYLFPLLLLLLSGSCNIIRGENSAGAGDKKEHNSIQLIEQSLAEGRIDRDRAYLLKSYALFDVKKLPEEYRSDIPVKDGTMLIRELRRVFDELGAETKAKIRPYLFRKGRKG